MTVSRVSSETIKVLIIDDSALVREVLTKILSQDKAIQVVGTAGDPLQAIKKIKELKPHVLTLDLEMPKMDGLTFLEKLMPVYPMPVLIISSFAHTGGRTTLKALELGAVDFITKPAIGVGSGLENISDEILLKIKGVISANMTEISKLTRRHRIGRKILVEDNYHGGNQRYQYHNKFSIGNGTEQVIAIGASTGGTVAVKNILHKLPVNMPSIVVVLHMPAGFTTQYAESLNNYCALKVKEAVDGDLLLNGYVYLAPGGKHLLVEKGSSGYFLKIDDSAPVNRHKPSVDVTFLSVAKNVASNSLGVILTGMGNDGAQGLKAMHDQGAITIAQDKKTSIVYGMPKQAVALEAVDMILPLNHISEFLVHVINKKK